MIKLLTPWQTTKPKIWHIVFFAIMLLILSVKVFALWPLLFVLGGTGAGTAWFFGFFESGAVATHGDFSVTGELFVGFYEKAQLWLWGGAYNGEQYVGIYDKFATALEPLFIVISGLMLLVAGFSFFVPAAQKVFTKVIKLIVYIMVVFLLLESNNFIKEYVHEPLMSLLLGIMQIYLGNGDVAFGGSDAQIVAKAIFGGVEGFFNEIFFQIERYWNSISLSKFSQAFAAIALVLAFALLYTVFSLLVILGFFGYFIMLSALVIILMLSIINKQVLFSWLKTTLNFFLIPMFTAAVMSITLIFFNDVINSLRELTATTTIFNKDIATALLVAIFSIGMHWKAPEFAAGISGGMMSGAGSIAGAAAAVGGGAWALSKGVVTTPTNVVSGFRGGNIGNPGGASYRGGQFMQDMYQKLRAGGTHFDDTTPPLSNQGGTMTSHTPSPTPTPPTPPLSNQGGK